VKFNSNLKIVFTILLVILLISIIFFGEIHNSLLKYKFYNVILRVLPIELKDFTKRHLINYSDLEKISYKNFKYSKKIGFQNFQKDLKKKYILNESQIKFNQIKDEDLLNKIITNNNFELFSVSFYDVIEFGVLIKNKKFRSNNLIIYIQGHRGNPFDNKYFLDLKNKYLNRNYDILALSMSNLGLNKEKFLSTHLEFPNKNSNNRRHEIYSDFKDLNYPEKKPLSLMLSGNYYLIKNILLKKNYDKIILTGISGGGWYTTLLTPIINEIDISISFSGTKPLHYVYYRCCHDWEQKYSSIWKGFNYEDFYYMSTFRLKNNSIFRRKSYQIYDLNEGEIFGGRFAQSMKKISDNINSEFFKVLIKDEGLHEISISVIDQLINENLK
jgi:hypothetical protein